MKNKILLSLLALALPFITNATVSGLTFTTDPQTIVPNTISDKLTVSSGEAVGKIADLALTSSSASGEFLNDSGEAVRPTWNSNWANRTFYYRDVTAGTYTITATLKTRASQESWSATQTITVGAGGGGNDDDSDNSDNSDNDADDGSNDNDSSPDVVTQNNSSAHSSQTPVGQVTLTTPFKIGAGRPRLVSVHSPVTFQVESTGATPDQVRYRWSFGDGGDAMGEQATHTYAFAGEYNVVISTVGHNGATAVGRTTVSVSEPAITFGQISADRVEIINKSNHELNLGGWRVGQGQSTFIFPSDTIITAGKKLVIPVSLLGFSPNPEYSLSLIFPDRTVALTSQSLESLNQSVIELSGKLAAIKSEVKANPKPVPVVSTPILTPPTLTPTITPPTTTPKLISAVATIPVPKAPSLFTRIKRWFTQ